MKKFAFVFTAAAVLVAAPLSAQWTAFTPNNDGAEFWDNVSKDGSICNAGYILTGVDTSNCLNQRTDGWLPYTGTTMDFFWGGAAPTNLLFSAGTFTFSPVQNSPQTDVAGQDRDWGYYTTSGGFVNLNGDGTLPFNVTINENWGLWVSMTSGVTAFSGSSYQFALFASESGKYIFGIEDINVRDVGSDRDYNDMFISIATNDTPLEVVPEPATMSLLATGLVGMAAARRRRKNQG